MHQRVSKRGKENESGKIQLPNRDSGLSDRPPVPFTLTGIESSRR
jgi:hypothetical protein